MKVRGIFAENKEAVNFLLDEADDPYIARYVNHGTSHTSARKQSPFTIVRHLHARNYPTGRQRVNDSGATSSAVAFFEVKTHTACKSRYEHNHTKTGTADHRATLITREYARKFNNLIETLLRTL